MQLFHRISGIDSYINDNKTKVYICILIKTMTIADSFLEIYLCNRLTWKFESLFNNSL